jgi:hypothetical protein
MGYFLEGDLLEVCDCRVLCPCWIGEDPDNGTCQTALAYHIREGAIDGVDVSGLTVATTALIPGNVLAGGYRNRLYIDARASDAQAQVLIEYTLVEGRGRFAVGEAVEAVMQPYRGPSGAVTTLNESIFSTIPGSPAYVARAERFRMNEPGLGIALELEGHNAIQGSFRFEHAP